MNAPEINQVERVEVQDTIALSRLECLKGNITVLNRRLAKHGLEAIELRVLRTRTVQCEDAREGIYEAIRAADVLITGPSYRLGAFELLASIDHFATPVAARALRPEAKVPVSFLTSAPVCMHCGTSRRRRHTFLLRDQDARIIQVGHSCLQEYTGFSPDAALAATSIWTEFNAMVRAMLGIEREEAEIKWGATYPLQEILFCAAMAILEHGFVSRRAVQNGMEQGIARVATADVALAAWKSRTDDCLNSGATFLSPHNPREEKALSIALAARSHAQATYPLNAEGELTDLEANLASIAASKAVDEKRIAIAVFLVQDYLRHLEKQTGENPHSQWLGEVGATLELSLTTLRIIELPSRFGIKRLHVMVDQAGNRTVWFCSGGNPLPLGETVRVKAKVKELGEWNGVKETMLTHVKRMEEPALTA